MTIKSIEESAEPTEARIAAARHAIAHNCDGPNTAFVLIFRACDLRKDSPEVAANALYEELTARGWLDDQAETDALRSEVEYLRRIVQAYKETAEARSR